MIVLKPRPATYISINLAQSWNGGLKCEDRLEKVKFFLETYLNKELFPTLEQLETGLQEAEAKLAASK